MRLPAARIDERVVDSGTEKFSGFSQGNTSSCAISDTSPGIVSPRSRIARTTPSDMIRLEQTIAVGAASPSSRLSAARKPFSSVIVTDRIWLGGSGSPLPASAR